MTDEELRERLVRLLDGDGKVPRPIDPEAARGRFNGRAHLELAIRFVGGALAGVVLWERRVELEEVRALRIVRAELTARARAAGSLP